MEQMWKSTLTLRAPKRLPRPPIPSLKSTLPKVLSRAIGEDVAKAEAAQNEAGSPESSLSSSHASSGRPMVVMQHCQPKGCYCQVGSVFKTALFLALILGVSAALAFWIYQNKFVSKDKSAVEEADGIANELDLLQLLRESGGGSMPKVFIDGKGALRRLVSDTKRILQQEEGAEFGPAHLSPAGKRTPIPVEAIEGLRRPRTILEEILQHLDSNEESTEQDDEEQSGEESNGWTCCVYSRESMFNSLTDASPSLCFFQVRPSGSPRPSVSAAPAKSS